MKKTKPSAANNKWKPVRRGNRYCSPWCGHGCTIQEYKAAIADGKALAKRLEAKLHDKGWTSRVWENLGWHFCAQSPCNRIKVHGLLFGTCTAYLGEPDSHGGKWVSSGRTPESAVRNVIKQAKADLSKIGAILKGLDGIA